MKNRNTGKALLSQLAVILFAALLLMCAVTSALAEQTGATDDPYHFGLNEEEDPNAGKATGTPKPTKTPNPTPTEFPFEPGLREDHEGHLIEYQIIDSNDWRHTIKEYCRTCRMTIKAKYTEDHQLDENGHCTKCSYQCKHDRTFVHEVPADGGEKTWDGNWISYPGTEITICYRCGKYLKYENTIIRKFHNRHTSYLMPTTWLPKDDNNHCADVVCLDCGTAFRTTHYHDFNRDAPFVDDGDYETHTHEVVCLDCGYVAERREPHHWVHDSYQKDTSEGTDEGHIEVFRCDVCGALRYEKKPHDTGRHIYYKANGDLEYHEELRICDLCTYNYVVSQPHELVHDSYKHDGDSAGHLDVYKCTVCGQTVETRVPHSPKHVIWKSVSDTQDHEVVYCAICGATYTLAPVAHQFDSFAYESDDMLDNHTVYRACVKCGACEKGGKTYTEAHVFNGSMCCVKCGQSSSHVGYHIAETGYTLGWVAVDDERHAPINKCKDYSCRAEFVNYSWPKPHTFDPVTMKCTSCGFLKQGCEHHYTQAVYHTKDGHYIAGNCVKCGKPLENPYFVQHTMQTVREICFQSSNNFHIRAEIKGCSVCGYERIVYNGKGAHAFISLGDNQCCGKCGYVTGTSCEHVFECTKLESQDAYAHSVQMKCSKCGILASKLEEHDLKVISDSGWKKANENLHTHTVHYHCSVCGYETTVTENEAHELSTMLERYENIWDPKVHNKITGDECKKCGFTTNENVEKLNHHFDVDIHGVVCTDCGYRRRY